MRRMSGLSAPSKRMRKLPPQDPRRFTFTRVVAGAVQHQAAVRVRQRLPGLFRSIPYSRATARTMSVPQPVPSPTAPSG